MKYLEYKIEDGTVIYVKSNIADDISDAGDYEVFKDSETESYLTKMETTIKAEMNKVKPFIKEVFETLTDSDNGPDELELEFGIAFSATMGLVITSGEIDTNFKVKTVWKK